MENKENIKIFEKKKKKKHLIKGYVVMWELIRNATKMYRLHKKLNIYSHINSYFSILSSLDTTRLFS